VVETLVGQRLHHVSTGGVNVPTEGIQKAEVAGTKLARFVTVRRCQGI